MGVMEKTKVNSKAEDLFVQLFCEVFGPEKSEFLQIQYPFVDIYGGHRTIDFAIENTEEKIAIEIDGATYHDPSLISDNKYHDDLLKQNSMVHQDWHVYRWTYQQLSKQAEKVKDELLTFIGQAPFLAFDHFLPVQKGEIIELRGYQQEALDSLANMREQGKQIALLYHATGIGKTVTAASDAKVVGGRTLFLVNALTLADQAEKTFARVWPEASRGKFTGLEKNDNTYVMFATVQTFVKYLDEFDSRAFEYIVVDECHHASSKMYRKIFQYIKPKFILGLSATPERSDGEDLLHLFQNVAHKMDLKTAVEQGVLVPIRCIRIKTDIDMKDVRIQGVKYNSQDLESKLFIPQRNELIVNTYLQYVRGKKSVIFCASVNHAVLLAKLLRENGVHAQSVSGNDKVATRNQVLQQYEHGDIEVLCACDLLNEGWDSPRTEVLFMARPTMSKTIYLQQLGRGTRKSEGKDYLLVFDFVDNANMFNQPYSLHRVLNIREYKPFDYVLGVKEAKVLDYNHLYKGEKPEVVLDIPIDIDDLEYIDLFDWQSEVKDMISQMEFIRMVNVQSETVEKYVREGKIVPDMVIPVSETRNIHYYQKETIQKYAQEFGWMILTNKNIKEHFISYITRMTMSKSYKPVLLKAMIHHMDANGVVAISDITNYFIDFYEIRRMQGQVIEKKGSVFNKEGYTLRDVEQTILKNPFKRFYDLRFVERCRDVEFVQFNKQLFKRLLPEEWELVVNICDDKLEGYYKERVE